jgi:hypothetical protein
MTRSPHSRSAKMVTLVTTLLMPLVIQLSPIVPQGAGSPSPTLISATAMVGVSAGQA